MYNKNVSEKVRSLSKKLEAAKDEKEFFDAVTGFYKDYGVGMFGLNKAFRIDDTPQGNFTFRAINNMDTVMLDDLVGYEIAKKKLIDNTKAFVEGKKANNCLLFGDAGTGKSSSIKAILNQYYDQGLRMIEVYKHQFKDLNDFPGSCISVPDNYGSRQGRICHHPDIRIMLCPETQTSSCHTFPFKSFIRFSGRNISYCRTQTSCQK